MRIDIRSKMIIVIGLPIAVVIIGAFILSLWFFREKSYSDARESLSRQSASYASRVDATLNQAMLLANSTAIMLESLEIQSFQNLESVLKRNVESNPVVFGAAVAIIPELCTIDGELFAPYAFRKGDEVHTMNIGRQAYDWFTDTSYEWFHGPAKTGKAQWTRPYYDKGVGDILMMTYASPIFLNDKFVGVCTVDIGLSQFDRQIQSFVGVSEDFVVVDREGRYIYTPDESRIIGGSFLEDVQNSENQELIDSTLKAIAGETGTSKARWHIDGEQKIMSYAPIPSTSWSYISYIAESKVTEHIRLRMYLPVLFFFTAITLIILSILKTSKKLTDPIVDLSEKVLQVAEGDLDVKVGSVRSNDEIADLVMSFNRMTEDLRNQINEIAKEELQKREAVEANQAKSQFLSHMSHELRTPLNGVLGYAQLMQRDQSIAPHQRRNLEGIINCGDHLLALINDVLDLSKIEAGREEISNEVFDLERLVRNVESIVVEKAKKKDIEFTVCISEEVPRFVLGDKSKIRQVLVNLTGNAIKFTNEGSVSLNLIEKSSGYLQFDVVDTGIGIPKEKFEVIFDPFKQTESGQSVGGTGLGLSISLRLAHLMDGDLLIDSELGEGSCFSFIIPLQESKSSSGLSLEEEMDVSFHDLKLKSSQKIPVLVADDGVENRDIIEQMLVAAGFEVLMTKDGVEALDLLSSLDSPPPIAFFDIRMPRLNGVDAMKRIRKNPLYNEMKIIAVTASVLPDFKAKALEDGFDDFMGKPFSINQLGSCLKRHLDVEFIRSEESSPLDPTQSSDVDENLLARSDIERLNTALKIRSLTQINQIISDLQKEPSTQLIAKEFSELAASFDFNNLQARVDALSFKDSIGKNHD